MPKITCSWCHAQNKDGRPPVFCQCGHRADRARMDCDCPKCKKVSWKRHTPVPWHIPAGTNGYTIAAYQTAIAMAEQAVNGSANAAFICHAANHFYALKNLLGMLLDVHDGKRAAATEEATGLWQTIREVLASTAKE